MRLRTDGKPGATVLVTGEAGIGKSRFLAEFRRASASAPGIFVRVRCAEHATRPYGPLIDAFAEIALSRFGSDRAPVASARESLTSARWGDDLTPHERTHRRNECVVAAVEDVARRSGSLCLVVDDVHWSDLGTLDALAALARASERLPILVVVALRIDELACESERAAAIAQLERMADRIALHPLRPNEILDQLREVLPDADARTLETICELSEGKPYVAEELARSIAQREASDRASTARTDLEPPLSLRGAVLQRFACLAPRERAILMLAAVFGRAVRIDDIERLDGSSREDVVRAIRAARDLQLVVEVERDGEPGVRFRHALTREVLYRELLAIERRDYHRRIAALFEAGDRLTRLADSAYHWWSAGDTVRALAANEEAGDAAFALAALGDAAACYARAEECCTTDADYARLVGKRVRALRALGRIDALGALAETAIPRLERSGYPDDAIRIHVAVTASVDLTMRSTKGLAHIAAARDKVTSRTPASLRYDVILWTAHSALGSGDFTAAERAFERAEREIPDLSVAQRRRLDVGRGYLAYYRGQLTQAATIWSDVRNAASATSDATLAATMTASLALVEHGRGFTRDAIAICDRAERAFERLGLAGGRARRLSFVAYYCCVVGDFTRAERLFADIIELADGRDDNAYASRLFFLRARGGDLGAYETLEREFENHNAYVIWSYGGHAPWIFADDLPRARSIVRRAMGAAAGVAIATIAYTAATFADENDLGQLEARMETIERQPDNLMHEVGLSLYRARLALRRDRPLEARGLARECVGRLERSDHWLERAHALALAGELDAAGRELLRVGATAEWERMRRLAGVPIASIAPSALSPRERQIARLVAAGRSSREVANALGITHRTVETHLANAYQKLEINSRAELAARLAGEANSAPATT